MQRNSRGTIRKFCLCLDWDDIMVSFLIGMVGLVVCAPIIEAVMRHAR